jgi:hypothetical protein
MQLTEKHLAELLTGIVETQNAIFSVLSHDDRDLRNALNKQLRGLSGGAAGKPVPLAGQPAKLLLGCGPGLKGTASVSGPSLESLAAELAKLLSQNAPA